MKASVVESVVTQLQGGLYGKCMRTVVSVSNYTVEVSIQEELRRIRFTLELEHLNDGDDTCEKKNKAKERCSVMAKTVNGHTVILWGSTSCSRDRGQSQITHLDN